MIGQSQVAELDNRSTKNAHIIDQADKIRFSRDKWIDSVYVHSNQFIKRKLEIEAQMKTTETLRSLIENNAKENDILNFLKQDPSFFGEAYANLDDEYIVFSEFPVADGFVDFVVFTGRSRMDVIFIEVKGANFNLCNQTGYGQFNAAIHIAAKQIRDRLEEAYYKNNDPFRKQCHKIRKNVEQGKQIYNSFIGAEGKLHVDPNKEIKIRSVIIGGKTVDDYSESLERHKFEQSSTIPVTLESWDTWIRKLKRA